MPLGYLHENSQSPRTPPSASGNMRIGIKNTFIEVMPPVNVPTQRAVTSPGNMEKNYGASSSFDNHNQQQQHQIDPQQRTGDAASQQRMDQSATAAYFDPTTGACNFGVPVQMVPYIPMAEGGGYPMQFVDPSAFQQSSEGDMQYGFSQQGAWFVPMAQCGFVPMNPQRMQSMKTPTSMDDQNGSNNFENQQYYKGLGDKPQYGNSNTKEKRPTGGRKQKETQGSNVTDGPKAVLVDLSKLRPVKKGDSVDWNTARLPATSARPASSGQGRNGWYRN
jgi:hypothetical protein